MYSLKKNIHTTTMKKNIRLTFLIVKLRVCPREDRAGVTHAISPISLKLSQMIKVKSYSRVQSSLGSRLIPGVQGLSHQIPGIKPRN